MLDPISDTPLVLAYVFMSLLVLIVCFIVINIAHKVFRSIGDEGEFTPTSLSTTTTAITKQTTIVSPLSQQHQQQQSQQQQLLLQLDALKTS